MTTKTSVGREGGVAAGLAALARRLETWRARRRRGAPIPEQLWAAAAAVARIHGLNPTAAALKLNYYALQRRVVARRRFGRGRRPRGRAAFVEVPPVPLGASPGERGTVELIHATGARLTLRFPDASPRDFLPLVHVFLRRQP